MFRFLRNNNHQRKRGFTLIELMMAVTILAILAVTGYTAFAQSQMRGRDVKRKNDLVQIAAALEVYYQQNGHYPCASTLQTSFGATSNWIIDRAVVGKDCGIGNQDATLSTTYIMLPVDPSNTGNEPWTNDSDLSYGYYSADWANCRIGQGYVLVTRLENSNDPESYSRKRIHPCEYATYPEPTWGSNIYMISNY